MSSSDVNLTSNMRSNLLLLQKTQEQVSSIQNKLATGNKVNSALDGPNAFFAAKSLTTRAADLTSLKSQMGQSISTIQAGDKGISAIDKLIDQAKGLTTSAYSSLGNDAASIATRKSLAQQFNAIKDQIDKVAGDSGYAGKNLLAGNGLTLDTTAASRTSVDSIAGLSASRVTNVVSSDTYSVSVSGTGAISGNLEDISDAESKRGVSSLKISGKLSNTAGNFSDISIEMRGAQGKERTVVVTEGSESRTFKFFDNSQSASTSTKAGEEGVKGQESTIAIDGAIEEGDTFTATVNGQAFTYKATAADLVDNAGADVSPTTRRENVAAKLRDVVNSNIDTSRFTIGAASGNSFTVTSAVNTGTGISFTVGAATTNAESKAVSVSFSSGTTVSFSVDRADLNALGTAANGKSTIEKSVDIEISATNLNGVTTSRSANNARGSSKLTDGENALSFDSGTVRVSVNSANIMDAATANSSANLTTVQRTDANTENDLNVQLNESNTNNIGVASINVKTDGQGLRIDYAQNDFLDRADIDKAAASLDAAKSTLRSASQSLSTNLNIIQNRESFTSDFSNILVDGGNKLTQADQNEEGANLLLLQTRQQLGTISLSLANQSQQSILRLF
ncbi:MULTISPECIES: flagellin [unclassified Azospirillum]|jgi:flagellin-like hook-associated protein FlgL|uniref:flagellin N-terminal helical domain-containing protein n=1 Tax=unclassified Azospirillum TaxID=2630922 RepID=UPI000B63C8C1|nr:MULTISPECIES: flagellin [unclassified Azospirillum]SNS78310.1 Flagellin FlgL [Azospirillum sp. RU38E]SNS95567.1 Flagellin FlgL [Azospirillum sp. RU37A]